MLPCSLVPHIAVMAIVIITPCNTWDKTHMSTRMLGTLEDCTSNRLILSCHAIACICTDKCREPYQGGCPERFRVCNWEPLDGDVCVDCLPGYISEYNSARCYREFWGRIKGRLS